MPGRSRNPRLVGATGAAGSAGPTGPGFAGIIDVRDWDILGNGTDETSKWQRLADYCSRSLPGPTGGRSARLYARAGDYRCGTVHWYGGYSFGLMLEGPLFDGGGGGSALFTYTGADGGELFNFHGVSSLVLRNLVLTSSSASPRLVKWQPWKHPSTNAIVTGCTNLLAERLRFALPASGGDCFSIGEDTFDGNTYQCDSIMLRDCAGYGHCGVNDMETDTTLRFGSFVKICSSGNTKNLVMENWTGYGLSAIWNSGPYGGNSGVWKCYGNVQMSNITRPFLVGPGVVEIGDCQVEGCREFVLQYGSGSNTICTVRNCEVYAELTESRRYVISYGGRLLIEGSLFYGSQTGGSVLPTLREYAAAPAGNRVLTVLNSHFEGGGADLPVESTGGAGAAVTALAAATSIGNTGGTYPSAQTRMASRLGVQS